VTAAPTFPVIGLTGAVAAGKSEALAAFARLGAETLSADAVVHELLASDRVRDLLVGRWGEEVAPDGKLDRERIGAIVFDQPDQLEWLEQALHPLVGERMAAWRAELPPETRAAVVEVPLLFESDLGDAFDATVAVVADTRARVQRAGARGISDLESRERRQLSQEEKAVRATYVVRNDGTIEDLEAGIGEILAHIEDDA
jgi:dephospho-CoA kinase